MNSKAINKNISNLEDKVDNFLDKINSKNKSKIVVEKYNNSDFGNYDSEEENEEDLLEKEFEATSSSESLPKNYGFKWSDEEIKIVFDTLLKGESKDLSESDSTTKKLAKKLNRSNGGVYVLIKKTVFERYIGGEEPNQIASELNLTYKSVKQMIKSFIVKDSDDMIGLLEKENKLLQLKIQNIKLKKELKELVK